MVAVAADMAEAMAMTLAKAVKLPPLTIDLSEPTHPLGQFDLSGLCGARGEERGLRLWFDLAAACDRLPRDVCPRPVER